MHKRGWLKVSVQERSGRRGAETDDVQPGKKVSTAVPFPLARKLGSTELATHYYHLPRYLA